MEAVGNPTVRNGKVGNDKAEKWLGNIRYRETSYLEDKLESEHMMVGPLLCFIW